MVAGRSASFALEVSNAPSASSTHGLVTAVQTYPEGVAPVAASGDGWSCATEGQTVTCDRPGEGADALPPGHGYPRVLTQVDVAPEADGDARMTSSVSTPDGAMAPESPTTFVIVAVSEQP